MFNGFERVVFVFNGLLWGFNSVDLNVFINLGNLFLKKIEIITEMKLRKHC